MEIVVPVVSPRVSVLMPVFNDVKYVSEAVNSILTQTFGDFELVIVDDGSNAETKFELRRLADLDPRIRLKTLKENVGVARALNEGLLDCRGGLVARMDSDDISAHDRLQRQCDFLDANPRISIVGGNVEIFGSDIKSRMVSHPKKSGELAVAMFFNCALVHPSVMCRATVLLATQYPTDYPSAEDYALWSHLNVGQNLVQFGNIGGPPILKLRKHANNVSKSNRESQIRSSYRAVSASLIVAGAKLTIDQALLVASRLQSPSLIQDFGELDFVLEAIRAVENFLLSRFDDSEEKKSISEQISKRLGEIATLSLKFCPDNPSESRAWRTWLSRNPSSQLSQLLSLLTPPARQPQNLIPKSISSGALDVSRLTVVCFSKDRAFQLKEYLRTLSTYVHGPSLEVTVLFKASPIYRKSYQKLTELFPKVSWVEETDFASQLKAIVRSSSDFILWGVDDVLFYNQVSLTDAMNTMRDDSTIIAASLRLAPAITYCHPSNSISNPPSSFVPCSTTGASGPFWLKFDRSEGNQDWNYPFELCATLFRRSDAIDIMNDIETNMGREGISHPNKFEVSGSRLFSRSLYPRWHNLNNCLCLSRLVLSVVTINRVQDVCENPVYDLVDLGTLDKYLWENKEFDDIKYREKSTLSYNSVHIGDVFLK